jgi:hypothetical protein
MIFSRTSAFAGMIATLASLTIALPAPAQIGSSSQQTSTERCGFFSRCGEAEADARPLPSGTLEPGMPFTMARRLLVSYGHAAIPFPMAEQKQRCGTQTEICRRFPEAYSCTEALPTRCVFLFRGAQGRITELHVRGDNAEALVIEAVREPKADEQARYNAEAQQLSAGRQPHDLDEAKAETGHPESVLRLAYLNYVYVRRCHESRKGYALVYITDAELEDARTATKQVEGLVRQMEPRLPIDQIWEEANLRKKQVDLGLLNAWNTTMQDIWSDQLARGNYNEYVAQQCKAAFRDLKVLRGKLIPSANILKKDF